MLAVAAVLLNWITTGDHLVKTIGTGYWPVAGLDLALLTSSALAVVAARKLRARDGVAQTDISPDSDAEAAHA